MRYEQVNAMLLNEFLKEHSKVQARDAAARQQQAAIDRLEKALAEEREAREAQGKLLQKIAARMEAPTAVPALADNDGQ